MKNIKTINDLRSILVEKVAKMKAGTTTTANVNAVVNAASKIINTITTEIKNIKLGGNANIRKH